MLRDSALIDPVTEARPVENQPLSVSVVLAWQIILWCSAIEVLTALFFLAAVPMGTYHLWFGLLGALVATAFMARDLRIWCKATLCLILAFVVATAVLGWLVDFSGDGQQYHLPAVFALAQGWNPFQVSRLAEWNAGFAQTLTSSIYVEHYAKGTWMLAAAVDLGTGALEAGKAFSLLLPLATWLLGAAFLRQRGFSAWWAHGLALAAAANPVSIYQLSTFYVDGQLAALCTLVLIVSLVYFYTSDKRWLVLLVACLIPLVNVKFTGLVYAACLTLGLAVGARLAGLPVSSRRYLAVAVASIGMAVILVGYQPYVTNTIEKGHPFYPALGRDDGRNVQWKSAPAEFLALNRAEKLARSILARSVESTEWPHWKLPFSVTIQELYTFFGADARYGGFGPLFGGGFLVASLLYVSAITSMPRRLWLTGIGLSMIVFISILPNPEAWWARLAPQLWLIPLILITVLMTFHGIWRRAAGVVLVLMLLNVALVAGLNWTRAVEKTILFREQIRRLQITSAAAPVEIKMPLRFQLVTERRLRDHAVSYRVVETLSCASPYRFSYPVANQSQACLP